MNHPALSVTAVSVVASPATPGVCGGFQDFTFTATFTFPANNLGGTVTYNWNRSDGATDTSNPYSLTVAPGTTSMQATSQWSMGPGSVGEVDWKSVTVLTPNAITSNHGTVTWYNCLN